VADENIFAVGAAMPGHYGPVTTGLTLTETSFAGAWNVQGDAHAPDFANEVRRLFDVALPVAPNTTMQTPTLTALWLGPSSWLLVWAGKAAPENFDLRRDALNVVGGALFDVTASRVAWTVAGTYAATVLAKSCPLDFHPRAFPEGSCAQSLFGHVHALVYRRAASPAFTLMVARSLARDAWLTLCRSAAAYGYDVLPPRFF
jgi:sarcosine oxidase subunit gamma